MSLSVGNIELPQELIGIVFLKYSVGNLCILNQVCKTLNSELHELVLNFSEILFTVADEQLQVINWAASRNEYWTPIRDDRFVRVFLYRSFIDLAPLDNSTLMITPGLFEDLFGKRAASLCTSNNMLKLARSGHKQTYIWCEEQRQKFLDAHPKRDCDGDYLRDRTSDKLRKIATHAIILAIQNGHQEITKYLEDKYRFDCNKPSWHIDHSHASFEERLVLLKGKYAQV